MSHQFLLFLLTGGTAAAINFCSRILYSVWIPFSYAVILAYLTGMVTAFVLAKLFVFKASQQSMQRSAVFFVIVNLVAIAQTWAISMLLLYVVFPAWGFSFYAAEYSHAVGVVVPVFTSYLGHKRWSFK
ncbi:MAG: GtrA family protein [Burkholderiales bacterium]|nr:GtrA family protein [Burkholderiales bacterium]